MAGTGRRVLSMNLRSADPRELILKALATTDRLLQTVAQTGELRDLRLQTLKETVRHNKFMEDINVRHVEQQYTDIMTEQTTALVTILAQYLTPGRAVMQGDLEAVAKQLQEAL
jgi:hypothetical protein